MPLPRIPTFDELLKKVKQPKVPKIEELDTTQASGLGYNLPPNWKLNRLGGVDSLISPRGLTFNNLKRDDNGKITDFQAFRGDKPVRLPQPIVEPPIEPPPEEPPVEPPPIEPLKDTRGAQQAVEAKIGRKLTTIELFGVSPIPELDNTYFTRALTQEFLEAPPPAKKIDEKEARAIYKQRQLEIDIKYRLPGSFEFKDSSEEANQAFLAEEKQAWEEYQANLPGFEQSIVGRAFLPSTEGFTPGEMPSATWLDRVRELSDTPGELIPFVGSSMEAGYIGTLLNTANKLEAGEDVGRDELLALYQYVERAQRDTSWGFKVLDVVFNMIPWGLEFLLTGGVYTAGRVAGTKAATLALKKYATKAGLNSLKGILKRYGIKITGVVVGGTLRSIPTGLAKVPAATLEKQLRGTLMGNEEAVWLSLVKSAGENWVETVSESAGELFAPLGTAAKGQLVKLGIFKSFIRANPTKSATDISKIMGRLGYNGIIGEMLEERVADVGHGILAELGLGDQKFSIPSWEQLSIELAAFSVPAVAAGVTQEISSLPWSEQRGATVPGEFIPGRKPTEEEATVESVTQKIVANQPLTAAERQLYANQSQEIEGALQEQATLAVTPPVTPGVTKPKAVARHKMTYGAGKSINFVEYEYAGERYITGTVVRGTDKSLGWYFGKGTEGLKEANRIALLSDEEFSKAEDLVRYSWAKTRATLSEVAIPKAEVTPVTPTVPAVGEVTITGISPEKTTTIQNSIAKLRDSGIAPKITSFSIDETLTEAVRGRHTGGDIVFRSEGDITPFLVEHELIHGSIEEVRSMVGEDFIIDYAQIAGFEGANLAESLKAEATVRIPIVEDLVRNMQVYLSHPEELSGQVRSFFDTLSKSIAEVAPTTPTVAPTPTITPEAAPKPVVEPVVPAVLEVAPPAEPVILPAEPIAKGVISGTQGMKDLGAKEKIRPARKVLTRIGQWRELFKPTQKAEVELHEEQIAKSKIFDRWQKLLGKDKARWALVSDEINKKGSAVGLTDNEKQVVTEYRKWADEWADRKDLSQTKRVKDYMPHLFEQEATRQIKEEGGIDPILAQMLSEKVTRKITDPFLKKRLGAVGWIKDPVAAARAYEAVSLKFAYYTPILNKIDTMLADPNIPQSVKNYLSGYSKRMTGELSEIDKSANITIREFAEKIKNIPVLGNYFYPRMTQGNPMGMTSYHLTGGLYGLFLGYKATSAIRNLSQHSLIIGEVGVRHFANGIRLRFTKEGKAAMKKSLVLRSRKFAYTAGLDSSFASRWTDKFRETALYMFRLADRQNVSDAFLAGYSEAKELYPEAGEQVWIDRGDEVAADTQYLYTKMNSMSFSQNAPGRTMSMLTTWTENWMELMTKWINRTPSQVYLEQERLTGKAPPTKNWSQTYKAITLYMVLVGLAFAFDDQTRLKIKEYTGIGSLRYLAGAVGGEFPAMEAVGSVASMVAGFLTDDERMLNSGLAEFKSTFTPGVVRQLDNVGSGEKDWSTLLFYLEGKDFHINNLKDKWEKGWNQYPVFETPEDKTAYIKTHPKHRGWSDTKIRNQWREDNPLLEAQMFAVSRFTTLSSDKARKEVLRLIEEHKIDTELIDGYEKIFGVDTNAELKTFEDRIGDFEDLVAGEEPKYFTLSNYASEVNKLVKSSGRAKIQKEASPLTRGILEAQDTIEAYDALKDDDKKIQNESRRLWRRKYPEAEAWMFLLGRFESFESFEGAEIARGLMEKYDIPIEWLEFPKRTIKRTGSASVTPVSVFSGFGAARPRRAAPTYPTFPKPRISTGISVKAPRVPGF